MKRFFAFALMLTLVSAPAFAARNSQTVNVPETIKAGSTQLAPGDYNVTWTGTAPNVQVTFTLNHKVLATVPAKLVEENNKNEGLTTDATAGVQVLEAIRLRTMTLVFEGSPATEK